MDYPRVNHEFVNPAVQVVTIGFQGRPTVQFGVLAEAEDVMTVAKLCFCSYVAGPGEKIILGHGDVPHRPDA